MVNAMVSRIPARLRDHALDLHGSHHQVEVLGLVANHHVVQGLVDVDCRARSHGVARANSSEMGGLAFFATDASACAKSGRL